VGVYGGYGLSVSAGPTIRTYAPSTLAVALLSILSLAATVVTALWRWRKGSLTGARVLFGAVWFGVALSPHVVSLPTLGVFANRYGYFPLLGLLFAAGGLLDDLFARASESLRRVLRVAVFVPVLIAAPVSLGAASLWKSEIDLFGADYAESPDDPQSLYFLGGALERKGGCETAVPYFRRAAELAPDFARASQNLAGCLLRTGKGAEAVAPAENALRRAPNTANLYNLALALEQAGRPADAAPIAERLARASPTDARFADLLSRLRAAGRPPPPPR
jgi:tetratricopeptide (TPR) repeat protein